MHRGQGANTHMYPITAAALRCLKNYQSFPSRPPRLVRRASPLPLFNVPMSAVQMPRAGPVVLHASQAARSPPPPSAALLFPRSQIKREINFIAHLSHPNIVRGIDAFADAEHVFLVQARPRAPAGPNFLHLSSLTSPGPTLLAAAPTASLRPPANPPAPRPPSPRARRRLRPPPAPLFPQEYGSLGDLADVAARFRWGCVPEQILSKKVPASGPLSRRTAGPGSPSAAEPHRADGSALHEHVRRFVFPPPRPPADHAADPQRARVPPREGDHSPRHQAGRAPPPPPSPLSRSRGSLS